MMHAIDQLTFAPVHCDDGLLTLCGYEVTFYTSHDREIGILIGSADAEPRNIHAHLLLSAEALVEQFQQYCDALG